MPCLQTSGPIRKYMYSTEAPVSPSLKDTRGNNSQFLASPMSVYSMALFSPHIQLTVPSPVHQVAHWVSHFPDDIFKYIFLNEDVWTSISPKFVPKGPIDNIPALVQIMAWRREGDKPLSEPMVVKLLTTFSNAFSWMKIYELRFRFNWSLFPRVQLTISEHWFR